MRADADRLPEVVTAPVEAVLCSMGLQVLQPLPRVLGATAAALRPGGALAATIPSTAALTLGDRARWLPVLVTLRTRPRYPNDAVMGRLPGLLGAAGLEPTSSEDRRFGFIVRTEADVRTVLDSLYLPDVEPRRRARADAVAARWVGDELGLSIRRVVAVRRR